MSELHRITVRPEQNGGRPSIRGLRVRVKDVLEWLAAGVSREEILADFPYLEAAGRGLKSTSTNVPSLRDSRKVHPASRSDSMMVDVGFNRRSAHRLMPGARS